MNSAMVIIACMLSGVAIAIVAWYHRRPRVSILERALVCVAIGLAVGAAVLGAFTESAERQRRVVHIGDRSIVLHAPTGFVMIGSEWPELWTSLEASYPEHRRLIVALVPEYTYTLLREHKVAELQRVLTIDVPDASSTRGSHCGTSPKRKRESVSSSPFLRGRPARLSCQS